MLHYRLLKDPPNCEKGRILKPSKDGKKYFISGTDEEYSSGALQGYSWLKEDVESNITWFAPIDLNSAIIEYVNKIQNSGIVHPLTCGNDSTHAPLIPIERDGSVILICKDCDYEQTQIPMIL